LGNLDAKRDWGDARDYVEMQWLMLQQEKPEDFIIATGRQFSVRDFVNAAANEIGIDIQWSGEGIQEKGINRKTGKVIIEVDPAYFRPTEVESLLGDPSKAKEKLGWEPKLTFEDMVKDMIKNDMDGARAYQVVKKHGFNIVDAVINQ